MSRLRAVLRDQSGVAIVMALIVLVAITGLALAFLSVSAFEPQISQNLTSSTQARYVADAGLEWAFEILVSDPNWQNRLAPATGANPNILVVANQPLPGLAATFGQVTVTMRNDFQPADPQMTGYKDVLTNTLQVDPGGPNADTNNFVILTSTGTVGGVTKTVSAVFRGPITLPSFNAALAMPGVQADFNAVGASFTINGQDTNCCSNDPLCPTCVRDAPGNAPPVYGISVSTVYPANNPGSFEQSVEASVAHNQQGDISGRSQLNPAQVTTGNNTIAKDAGISPTIVANFVAQAKSAATTVLSSKMATGGLSYNNLNGGTAGSMWGTPTSPAIVYIKGEPDPTSNFTALDIGGNSTGYGILIVEDGDLRIHGNFLWNGPIIVTGQYVGIGFMGGGNQTVYGAVISNEMQANEPAGYFEAYVNGNSKIQYSKQAMNMAINGGASKGGLFSWREQ